MPRAEFTITFPDGVWIGAVSRDAPETLIRVLSAFPTDERGYALVEVVSPDHVRVLEAMEGSSAVVSLECLQSADDRAVAQFETTELPLLVTIQRAQLPVEFPIDIRDGEATLSVRTSHDRISRFGDQLDALELDYRLDRIHATVDGETALTDRQRELLLAALDAGYYDTPRETSLTALAESLGTAPSTVSEALHRAEEAVVKTFATESLDWEE